MTKVLMVCMGNICRSPMAEGILRKALQETGLDRHVEVDSAGTHGYHAGEAPDQRTKRAAAVRHYDLSNMRARKVAAQDLDYFDLILAMDRDNLARLQQLQPDESRARLALMLEYATDAGVEEVPDPYYGGPAGFEQVLDLLEDAAEGLLQALRSELRRPVG